MIHTTLKVVKAKEYVEKYHHFKLELFRNNICYHYGHHPHNSEGSVILHECPNIVIFDPLYNTV